MNIEVYLDTSCPYCYIGKKNLETALETFPNEEFNVIYKSFELDNQAKKYPSETLYQYLAERYDKSIADIEDNNEPLVNLASDMGLTLNLEHAIPSNTRGAHRLLKYAKKSELEHPLLDNLYYAHFTENKNLADKDTLLEIAVETGLDEKGAKEVIDDISLYIEDVIEDENYAHVLGIKGVPFFIFDKKHALNGAREVPHYIQAIETALADRN